MTGGRVVDPPTGPTADPQTESRIIEILHELVSKGKDSAANQVRGELLNQLLEYTRSSRDDELRPLFTQGGIRVLGYYAFGRFTPAEYRAALRCLNNILVRSVPTRQMFVDEGYPRRVVELMKGDPEDELPTASLLFYCLMRTNLNLRSSLEHHNLAGVMARNISRHADERPPSPNDPASASAATLKLLAVLLTRYEAQHAHRFRACLRPLLAMFERVPIPSPPLQFPVTLLAVCIGAIPPPSRRACRPRDSGPSSSSSSSSSSSPSPPLFSAAAVDKLVGILNVAILAYFSPPGTEHVLLPLFQALRRAAQSESESESGPGSRSGAPLPNEVPTARERVVAHLLLLSGGGGGGGSSSDALPLLLPHRVLRLAATTADAELREAVMALYMELSDGDAAQFLHNVGYDVGMAFVAAKGVRLSDYVRAWAEEEKESARLSSLDTITTTDSNTIPEGVGDLDTEELYAKLERLNVTGIDTAQYSEVRRGMSKRDENMNG